MAVATIPEQKEVIRRRGENLAPVEVEDTLMAHPAVAEVGRRRSTSSRLTDDHPSP